jgi:hypothetical protein
MVYDLVTCPHRITMDLSGDPARRNAPNPFVRMLWERGSLYEREVIAGLAIPFIDLSSYPAQEKERLTLDALRRGESRRVTYWGARPTAQGGRGLHCR